MSTIYVSLSSTPAAPYDTWETAFNSIQSAVNYASDGDSIVVDDGEYILSSQISIAKGISISSKSGNTSTIINGRNAVRCFNINHPSAYINGLTVKNGYATAAEHPLGGGFRLLSGAVYGCIVNNCHSSAASGAGGGFYIEYGSVSHCTINGCSAPRGGGIANVYDGAIDNCLLYDNQAFVFGGGIWNYSTGEVINCTICDNSVTSNIYGAKGGGVYGSGTLTNCIVYFNTSSTNYPNICCLDCNATYCCSPEGIGTNSITSDPLLQDRANDDYRLSSYSPCCNAGLTSAVQDLDNYDLDGNPRVFDEIVDLGAYELQEDVYISSSSSASSLSSESSSSSSQSSISSASSSLSSSSSESSESSSSSSSSSESSESSSSSSSSSESSESSFSSSVSSVSSSSSSSSSYSSSSISSLSSESSSSSVWKGVIFELAEEICSSPSLIVDVLNSSELIAETKLAFGDDFKASLGWVTNERLRGDFSLGMTEWGFKQANGKTSNAVVFSGEKVVIHIATKGHGVGFVGSAEDGPVFSKTKIRLTLHDLNRNVDKSIVFDSFSKPINHASRYVLWTIGETDAWVQADRESNTTCGTYVLTISDESELYRRADWTYPIELDTYQSFPQSESHLCVTAYEWRDVLAGVQINPSGNAAIISAAEFRTSPVGIDAASEDEVFDSMTIFPSYETTNGLSSEQKKTVIRDNAMVLLASQGPILPADAPQSPVIGMGMTIASQQNQSLSVPSSRPAEQSQIVLPASRTFSLTGKPAATNVLDDLINLTSERNQAYLSFFDPPRVLSFATDGSASKELNDGIAWIVSGTRISDMRLACGDSVTIDLTIGDEAYEIDTEGDWASSSSSVSSSSSEIDCGDSWIVSDFGTSYVNGTYVWDGTTMFNGKRVYLQEGGIFKLLFSSYFDMWTLTNSTGGAFTTYYVQISPGCQCPDSCSWRTYGSGGQAPVGTIIRA